MEQEMLRAMARNYAYGRLDEQSDDHRANYAIARDFTFKYMEKYHLAHPPIPTSIRDEWVQYAAELQALVVVNLGETHTWDDLDDEGKAAFYRAMNAWRYNLSHEQ